MSTISMRHETEYWRDRVAAPDYDASDMVLCQSPDGWSYHAPGSTDDEIAEGDAKAIHSGPGRPTQADREEAFRIWVAR